MDEKILSDQEIRDLFNSPQDNLTESHFTKEEIDALGEIGNISIGTSATTLYSLFRNKVVITAPNVSETTISQLKHAYPIPFIAVEVNYTKGLEGSNLMIIREQDAKIIANLMMGGDGQNVENELDEIGMSAVGEAMNQMMGSASTSLSTMLKKDIGISPPKLCRINFASDCVDSYFDEEQKIVNVSFKMEVGNLIKSEIMLLMQIDFAKSLVSDLYKITMPEEKNASLKPKEEPRQDNKAISQDEITDNKKNDTYSQNNEIKKSIVANPVKFETFDEETMTTNSATMDLIMDVPLEVTVELGSTQKSIKEILQFGIGSIIELNKMAGEPVDILVNNKLVAKGEVVVIDENFGVRVTEIIHSMPSVNLQ